MSESTISLMKIGDLEGMVFNVPNYQRGYRWEKIQVIELLDDFLAFMEKKTVEEIYCIQPLVVKAQKENEDFYNDIIQSAENRDKEELLKLINSQKWDVVDGQQRLTTIFIILKCLGLGNYYSIEYETRKKSAEFLNTIEKEKSNNEWDENVDFYHMYKIKTTIDDYFKSKEIDLDAFKKTLLNNVTFIWYETNEDKPISVFTRLNIGKIALTDSELIKALFMNRKKITNLDSTSLYKLQTDISKAWDEIEYKLQDDELWLFIMDKNYSKPTRIDFIFDLMKEHDVLLLFKNIKTGEKERKIVELIGNDEHETFRYFYVYINSIKDNYDEELKQLWKKVKEYYKIFIEWYNDFNLYHYIGYLSIVTNENKFELINDLIIEYKSKDKEEFLNCLLNKINKILTKKTRKKNNILDFNLDYDSDGSLAKTFCKPILLLHNVLTVIEQNDKLKNDEKYGLGVFYRFPFHLYKKEENKKGNKGWEVEHIRSNAGDDISKLIDQKIYLKMASDAIDKNKYEELIERINRYLKLNEESPEEFRSILDILDDSSNQINDNDKNKIWNFTLLDSATNEEYHNSIFPVKRIFIINKENGFKPKYVYNNNSIEVKELPEIAFVPPCTKNVFSKAYTLIPDNLFVWTMKDACYYRLDMEIKLWYFLCQEIFDILKINIINDKDRKKAYNCCYQQYKTDILNNNEYSMTMKEYFNEDTKNNDILQILRNEKIEFEVV